MYLLFYAPRNSLAEKEEIIKKIIELGSNYQSLYKINGYPYKHKDLAYGMTTYPLENNIRCFGIKFILEKFLSKKNIKVIDIGTDTGYISHCLADNGLTVHGVDSNNEVSDCISNMVHTGISNLIRSREKCTDNYNKEYENKETRQIQTANLVKKYNKLKNVTFKSNIVDLNYVKNLKVNQYDSALILSVLHWMNLDFGLKNTKELLNELLKKVPIVIIEATQKTSVPDDGFKGFGISESLTRKY